ncbi:MAG: GlsB/YeaQ/YmgE family stress response membrane protein [Tabrizicola sp.]
MPLVALLIVGVAVGFLASRILKVNMDTPSTIALGVLGALIGTVVLRGLVMLAGIGAGFVGALIGALLLIWAWKTWAK